MNKCLYMMLKLVLLILFLILPTNIFSNNEKSENFDYFIIDFFANQEFQKSRTLFPLEYTYYDPGAEVDNDIFTVYLSESDWIPMTDSSYIKSEYFHKIYDNFDAKLRETGKRVFAYEGNQICLRIYLYFELREEKWFLIKKEDFSS